MPSAPAPGAGARREAERPTAGREYTSNDSLEMGTFTVPAGTTPAVAFTFSGMPDSILINFNIGTHFLRFRNPGEPATVETVQVPTVPFEYAAGYRIIEVRDSAGGGGATMSIIGRYGNRHIERRVSRRGPLLTTVRDYQTAAPEQVTPR